MSSKRWIEFKELDNVIAIGKAIWKEIPDTNTIFCDGCPLLKTLEKGYACKLREPIGLNWAKPEGAYKSQSCPLAYGD